MIKSMTGYGKVTNSYEKFDVIVELKSVNSKYFDPSFRTPKSLSALEIPLRNLLQEHLVRGKLDVRIELVMKVSGRTPTLNTELLSNYKSILEEIVEKTEINDNIRLEHFLRVPDLIEYKSNDDIEEELHTCVRETVSDCIKKIDEMRVNEGIAMINDISSKLSELKQNIDNIVNAKTDVFKYWFDKFNKRLSELNVVDINEERIVQEATVYGEKADISEEITRLYCHIEQFSNIISNEDAVGKKLDFLCQEIHRELNTIASKSTRVEIISTVVESKALADRIREQVQNII